MQGQDIWFSYWYFHLPNYALSVLFWTLIGRFLFGLVLRPDSPNYIYRWFRRLTDWLIRPVAYITPSIVPPLALAPVAAFWVALFRVMFFIALHAAGLTPRVAH
jgi:YggT family protein